MNKLFRSIILLTFCCLPFNTFAQELPTIVKKLEKVFEQKEPKWKIEKPYVQMSPPVMHLESAQGHILIYFWLMTSDKDAEDVFDGNAVAFRNMHGKRTREVKLLNFGDDNHLLSGVRGGFVNFDFRKDAKYISVVAPSQIIAKRFAQYIMEQIIAQNDKQATVNK